MEIKGMILKGGSRSLNCCESITDIEIEGVSLYDEFERLFSPDGEYPDDVKPRELRYIILDEIPEGNMSFNQAFADATMKMLYAEHAGVCYSEYTCGYGGFDYVVNNDRSIFLELADHEGKYIHLSLE